MSDQNQVPQQPIPQPDPYQPPAPGADTQDQLNFNSNIRNMIIARKIGPNGQNIDHMDSKELKVILTAVKDQDAQALSKQRLEIENKAVDNAAQRAREIIPHLYHLMNSQPQPAVPINVTPDTPLPFNVPQDPNTNFVVLDSMLEVGQVDETYNVFMGRTQPPK